MTHGVRLAQHNGLFCEVACQVGATSEAAHGTELTLGDLWRAGRFAKWKREVDARLWCSYCQGSGEDFLGDGDPCELCGGRGEFPPSAVLPPRVPSASELSDEHGREGDAREVAG